MHVRTIAIVNPLALILGLMAFVALLGWGEYSNWKTQVSRVEAGLEQSAAAIAQHADDVIDMSRLPLASLTSEIVNQNGFLQPVRIHAMIMRLLKASSTIGNLSYIGADGQLVATSVDVQGGATDYSDRDYFLLHKTSPLPLPVVGKPIQSRITHQWIIPISQRVALLDGSFGGIVVSTIPVNHFVNFFRNFQVGANGSLMLLRGDGTLLARGPMDESMLGEKTSLAALGHGMHLKTDGDYFFHWPMDDDDRIGGLFQSQRTGLTVIASASERDAFIAWVQSAQTRWFYAMVLLLVTVLALLYWRRQSRVREMAAALVAAREAEFRLLAESSSDMISRFDANGIREYVSPSCRQVLGIEAEVLVGRSAFANMAPDVFAIVRPAADRMLSGQSQTEKFVTPHVKPSGERVWLETALSALPDPSGRLATRVVAVSRDVTRHKLEQDALDLLANSDELTGLANRRFFNSRFDQMVDAARQTETPLALLMIDADRFKFYNDNYGHAAGDECLRQIAGVIRSCVHRPTDVAARYGGEEMAVLLAATDAAGAAAVAEQIRASVEALAMPHELNPPPGRVTVSIGTAVLAAGGQAAANLGAADDADRGLSAETLFSDADAALYKAKTRGRNRVVAGGRPAVVLRSVL